MRSTVLTDDDVRRVLPIVTLWSIPGQPCSYKAPSPRLLSCVSVVATIVLFSDGRTGHGPRSCAGAALPLRWCQRQAMGREIQRSALVPAHPLEQDPCRIRPGRK
jgi:hypothetical protein